MAVVHDADSNANSGAGTVASLTWSHTTTGSNTLLVVGLTWIGNTATMTSVTHAGNNPTGTTGQYASTGTIYNTQIWWWVNPTTGAQNIIATPSTSTNIFGGGATFTGVDQTTPVFPLDMTSGQGSGFGNISIGARSSGQNEMIFNLVGLVSAVSTLTAVSPGTQAFNQSDATPNRTGAGEYYSPSQNGLSYPVWTISGSTARIWAMQSIAINPVGGLAVPHNKFNNSGLRPHPLSPGNAR